MKLALSPRLEELLSAKAEALGISCQDAIRMLVASWVSDGGAFQVPQKDPKGYPKGPEKAPGEPLRRGSSSSSSSVVSSESSGSGEGGGVSSGWEGEKELPQSSGDSKGEEGVKPSSKARHPKRAREPEPAVPIPPLDIDSPELRATLEEFAEYRRRLGKPLTEKAWTLQMNRLRRAGREAHVALQYAMHEGWESWQPQYTQNRTWSEMREDLGMPPPRPEPMARAPAASPRLAAVLVGDRYEDHVWSDGRTYTREEWTAMGRAMPAGKEAPR